MKIMYGLFRHVNLFESSGYVFTVPPLALQREGTTNEDGFGEYVGDRNIVHVSWARKLAKFIDGGDGRRWLLCDRRGLEICSTELKHADRRGLEIGSTELKLLVCCPTSVISLEVLFL